MKSNHHAVNETRLRVRYAETDQMGVVYYANHFVWMEVGRVDLCKACGFNYRDLEREDGIFFAVAEANGFCWSCPLVSAPLFGSTNKSTLPPRMTN